MPFSECRLTQHTQDDASVFQPDFSHTQTGRLVRRKPVVKRELWGGEFRTDGCPVAIVGERANW